MIRRMAIHKMKEVRDEWERRRLRDKGTIIMTEPVTHQEQQEPGYTVMDAGHFVVVRKSAKRLAEEQRVVRQEKARAGPLQPKPAVTGRSRKARK